MSDTLSPESISTMTVKNLKKALRERGLPQNGNKAALQSRLRTHIETEQEANQQESEPEPEPEPEPESENNEAEEKEEEEKEIELKSTETPKSPNEANLRQENNKITINKTSILSELEIKIRKEERKKRFGIKTDQDRIESRKRRFQNTNLNDFSLSTIINNKESEPVSKKAKIIHEFEKRELRQQRFNTQTDKSKQEARKLRFGIKSENDKINERKERFNTNGVINDDKVNLNKLNKIEKDNLLLVHASLDDINEFNKKKNIGNNGKRTVFRGKRKFNKFGKRNNNGFIRKFKSNPDASSYDFYRKNNGYNNNQKNRFDDDEKISIRKQRFSDF